MTNTDTATPRQRRADELAEEGVTVSPAQRREELIQQAEDNQDANDAAYMEQMAAHKKVSHLFDKAAEAAQAAGEPGAEAEAEKRPDKPGRAAAAK